MDAWMDGLSVAGGGGGAPRDPGVKLWLLNVPTSRAHLVFPSKGKDSHWDPAF